jgi:hypothetical protein
MAYAAVALGLHCKALQPVATGFMQQDSSIHRNKPDGTYDQRTFPMRRIVQ